MLIVPAETNNTRNNALVVLCDTRSQKTVASSLFFNKHIYVLQTSSSGMKTASAYIQEMWVWMTLSEKTIFA